MLKVHQDIILSNLAVLVEGTDLNALVPELLNRNVFNERMINRILNPSHSSKRQKTDLYVEILKRGPQAFDKLQDALVQSNHSNLAETLKAMDSEQAQFPRSPSLNSVGSIRSPNSSENDNDSENDGPCLSTSRGSRKRTSDSMRPDTFPENLPSSSWRQSSQDNQGKSSDFNDFHTPSSRDSEKVFNLPAYSIEVIDHTLKKSGLICPGDKINYNVETNRPVIVKMATNWQSQVDGRPRMYKMDSNPRGCALIINNKEYYNKHDYPDRLGSDNDETRMKELLKQLYFNVELHRNKTKREMERIVKKFCQKEELNYVDCVLVVFMSHGQAGESDEDTEIIGVDGIGYKTEDIISQFYNDNCRALINKPKIFLFQACRGNLTDPGVTIGHLYLGHRIETDGKKNSVPARDIKIRTHSDIFVAYPVAAGRKANRDYITGAWFIQTIVDVFSEFACNAHLEDLFKMVDERIKKVNNLHASNFQAVTTKTVGWDKNLFFNPGLSRDKITRATLRQNNTTDTPTPMDEGSDVVDSVESNSVKNPYSRLKNNGKGSSQDDDGGSSGCWNVPCCSTS